MTEEILTLDRREGNIAVCFYEDGRKIELPAEIFSKVKDGTIVRCTLDDDGTPVSVQIMEEETERVREENSARLRNLFGRRK